MNSLNTSIFYECQQGFIVLGDFRGIGGYQGSAETGEIDVSAPVKFFP